MSEENCGNCKHFRKLPGKVYNTPNAQSCTANPPQVSEGVYITSVDTATGIIRHGRYSWSSFPIVLSNRICGSWRAK